MDAIETGAGCAYQITIFDIKHFEIKQEQARSAIFLAVKRHRLYNIH
jgi:hypothetical protein